MRKRFKKWGSVLSILTIGALLGPAAMTASAPDADAGIILAPIGVGIILIIVGVSDQSVGLTILSGSDGTLRQDSLAASLMSKYQSFGIDTQTASDLSALISQKYPSSQGMNTITISLSRDELSRGLAASNIESDNPALFNQIVTDMHSGMQ